jgi:transposase
VAKFLEICAGIDIGKREISVALLKGPADAEPNAEIRTFGTTVKDLTECGDWLREAGCRTAVLESTGAYWIPVFNVLDGYLAIIVANPAHVKARRGEKTDAEDSRRLAERLRSGDVRGSFVPPENIATLRDLTRRRKKLLSASSAERNRVQKLLERANVKFGNVVSDVFGVSGQRFLNALLNDPAATPEQIAELARTKLRNKKAEIAETLRGHRLNDHLRWMIRHSLAHLVFLESQLNEIHEQITATLVPFEQEFQLLQTIPGVGADTAAIIIAETGGNMAQFPSARHLTSWAGVCPGNNRSAGRQMSSAIKRGNPWLMAALVQAGWAAVRCRGTIFKKRFYRLMQHRGRKKAVVAAARPLLSVIWIILNRKEPYRETVGDYQPYEQSKKIRHHLRKLAKLGIDISHIQLPPPTTQEMRLPDRHRPSALGTLGVHAR